MITIETIATFFVASTLLARAPGPDNIFVLTQSALHAKGAGLVVMLGLCTGLIGHSTALALGVAVIFQTSMVAFTALKMVGAAYLGEVTSKDGVCASGTPGTTTYSPNIKKGGIRRHLNKNDISGHQAPVGEGSSMYAASIGVIFRPQCMKSVLSASMCATLIRQTSQTYISFFPCFFSFSAMVSPFVLEEKRLRHQFRSC